VDPNESHTREKSDSNEAIKDDVFPSISFIALPLFCLACLLRWWELVVSRLGKLLLLETVEDMMIMMLMLALVFC